MGLGYNLRGVQNLCGGGITDDPAVMKSNGAGGVLQHQMHVVGNENYCDTLTVQRPEKIHNLRVMTEILACGGLIQNQNLGPEDKNGGDGHTFFLPIAQGGDWPVPERIESADFQRFFHPGPDLFLADTAVAQSQGDLVKYHGFGDHLVGILHHIADLIRPLLDAQCGQILTVQGKAAGLGLFKAADYLGKGGFPCAVCSYDTEHFSFVNGNINPLQGMMATFIGKINSLCLQNNRSVFAGNGRRLSGKPFFHLIFLGLGQHQLRKTCRVHIRRGRNASVFECGNIERFPDAAALQKGGTQHGIRVSVVEDPSVSHDNNPVHMPVEHILQPVLNNNHGAAGTLLNLVDQLNGLLTGGGVQIGKRLIKQKHVHLIDHHARKAHALLLPAGDFVGRMAQDPADIHQVRCFLHNLMHFIPGNAVVFQSKGNILRNSQSDKLSVGILKDCSDGFGQAEQAQFHGILPLYGKRAGDFSRIRRGNQTVDAVGDGGLTAAGGTGDEHLFPTMNVQIDVIEGRRCLGGVLESKIPKGYEGFFLHAFLLTERRQAWACLLFK